MLEVPEHLLVQSHLRVRVVKLRARSLVLLEPAAQRLDRLDVGLGGEVCGREARVAVQEHWRRFNGHELVTNVLADAKFKDGIQVEAPNRIVGADKPNPRPRQVPCSIPVYIERA
jgi:hypothetical protein